jgi:hypothetical protein
VCLRFSWASNDHLEYVKYLPFPGRDADPSPPSTAEAKHRVELYLSLPKGLCGLWQGETYLFTYLFFKIGNENM